MKIVLVALGLALVSLPALAEGLQTTNRSEEQVNLVEAYAKEQGLFLTADSPEPSYSDENKVWNFQQALLPMY